MKVVFRTDSSTQIGSGHLMRCLTLSEGLHEKGAEVLFICRDLPGNLNTMVKEKGFEFCCLPAPKCQPDELTWNRHAAWLRVHWQQDTNETLDCLKKLGSPVDWLVVDHYALDEQWESQMRSQVEKIMVLDDLADRQHNCDLLLDQNLYRDKEHRYKGLTPDTCQQMLGPTYALLRREFIDARQSLRLRTGHVLRVLIFYGGSDPGNETTKALEALQLIKERQFEVDVVVGVTNPNKNEIETLCTQIDNVSYHCQVENMAELMASTDLMLCSGGTVTWERCALGLPGIVTATAVNQEKVAEDSSRNGLSFYLGSSESVTPQVIANTLSILSASSECLQMYSDIELSTVDAKGVQRIAGILIPPNILLRPATSEDCNAIYEWRNAEETRRYIFDPEPITLEAHRKWFRDTLDNPDRILLIGEIDESPVGVVRYDLSGDEALISVYLVPGIQGQGVGTQLIRSGSDWLKQNYPSVKAINAEILSVNIGSLKAFEQAGYKDHHRIYKKVL